MSSVIVQGVFRVNPAERDAYLAASSDNMRSSRAEQGCLEYVLAADPLDEGRVILSERWQSRLDLDAHIQGMAARRSEAAARGDSAPGPVPISREVTIYEVATEQVMS
jgi:quinol monooxygenase YgiN